VLDRPARTFRVLGALWSALRRRTCTRLRRQVGPRFARSRTCWTASRASTS
jgi:hypothetical protein